MLIITTPDVFQLQVFDLSSAAKVKVDVYYETLCPDSINFIKDQLFPTYQSVGSIIDLTLVPFGKAWVRNDNNRVHVSCHHGPSECEGNIIQACAIDLLKNTNTSLQLVNCMESAGRPNRAGESCALSLGIDYNPIKQCAQSDHGKTLHLANGNLTGNLNPKLTFVPWIIINGRFSEDNQRSALYGNFAKLLCDNYSGPPHPGCSLV